MTGNELEKLLDPTIKRLGYELSDLEVKLGAKSGVIRVFIDHPDGVGIDDCEKVSHAVSALLDVENPAPGHYDLEVSSPGFNRKLTKVEHFQRFAGEIVKVEMRFPIAGRKRFHGTLMSSDEENIVCEQSRLGTNDLGQESVDRVTNDIKLEQVLVKDVCPTQSPHDNRQTCVK